MALWDLLKNKQATSGNDNGDSAGGGLSSLLSLFGGNKEDDEYGRNLPPLQREDNSTPSNRIYLNDRIGFKSNTNINSPNLDTITGGAANQGSATVTGLQLSPDGSVMYEINTPNENKSADMGDGYFKRAKSGIKNFNLSNALFGNQAQATDNVGTQQGEEVVLKDAITGEPVAYKTTNNMTVSSNPRVGGLLNDLIAGADENYNNRFSINNWQNNDLDYGRKKGAAYRIGEGLGSLGRALATWGGDAWIAGSQGLDAAMKRQGYRTGDQLYRQQLKDNYGYTDEQLNNLKGYITKDDFTTLANNIYKNQALKVRQDIANAKDKRTAQNLIFRAHNNGQLSDSEAQLQLQAVDFKFSDSKDGKPQLKASNSTRNADMNEYLAPHKANAYDTGAMVGMGNLGLNQARFNWQVENDLYDREHPKGASISEVSSLRKEFSGLPPVKNSVEITRQYNNVSSLYQQYKAGKIGKNAFDQALITTLNKVLDPTSVVRESEFDRTAAGQAMWDKLSGYATKLTKGGSGLTDANRADLVNALTTMKRANDNEVARISNDYADLAYRYGINPADIMPRHYKAQTQSNANTVLIKAPNGQIKRIPVSKKEAALKAGGKLL